MSEAYIGEIRMFAGDFTPLHWYICAGTLIPITQEQALYSLIGTTYGGNGVSNFGLPDFRGRIPVNQGQGPGLTHRCMGDSYGLENVCLEVANLPFHSHTLQASNETANTAEPMNNVLATGQVVPGPDTGSVELYSTVSSKLAALEDEAVGNYGGDYPHPNCMPTLAINYIICSQGIFPQRS